MIEQRGIEGPLTATLEGRLVTLEPLAEEHRDGLWEAAQADEIWTWLAHLNKSREDFDEWFDGSPASNSIEAEGVFAVRRASDGVLVGSSRYLYPRAFHRVAEIGWDRVTPPGVNTGGQ